MQSVFQGLKVLDVGSWIAGPVAATIMADYGAEVIKIEMPGVGDQYRLLSANRVCPMPMPTIVGKWMLEINAA